MWSIFWKEIHAFFNSLVAYVVIILFLTGIGLYMWVFPDTVFDYGIADISLLFTVGPYVFMFLIPAITMRTFAEEKKAGTLELILTRPITEWQLLLGKYFAALTLVVLALVPTLLYYYTVYTLGAPQGNVDTAGIVGSYLGLILLASVMTSLGIFSSSLTDNQIVAFISSLFLSLLLFEGVGYISQLDPWGNASYFISKLSISSHYQALGKGVIDTRNVMYILSLSLVFLMSTRLVLVSRKW